MLEQAKRYIIASDNSEFVGRIYDLSIVGLHFDSYEDLLQYPDAKYALDVNNRTSLLTSRVESLNDVGAMLWPEKPVPIETLPVSAYEYCNIIQDAFLMRIISVLDCCCLLVVEVLQLDLVPRRANLSNIQKLVPANPCCKKLEEISSLQRDLRAERNARFHAAEQEAFTDDDQTFKTVSRFHHWGSPVVGADRHGKEIDIEEFYKSAIEHLRLKFNSNVEDLEGALGRFYESINVDFENRFRSMCKAQGSFMQVSKRR